MTVRDLKPSHHSADRWIVSLENGETLHVGESEVLAFSLHAGCELQDWQVKQLKTQAGIGARREHAIDLLSRKPLSKKELTDRLLRWGADEEEAKSVCQRMEQLGYLNDELYAQRVVKHYSEKGYGERRLREELYRRGVPREYWEQALTLQGDAATSIDAFVAKRTKNKVMDEKEFKSLSDALARRGYSWGDISAAIERFKRGQTAEQ